MRYRVRCKSFSESTECDSSTSESLQSVVANDRSTGGVKRAMPAHLAVLQVSDVLKQDVLGDANSHISAVFEGKYASRAASAHQDAMQSKDVVGSLE